METFKLTPETKIL